ncbi:hypothetical protein KKF55_00485 [Patescibacteria group bacterium]|nr:hypothetical protein [Patescibacteria group bacterium]
MRQQFIFGIFSVIFLTSCTVQERLSPVEVMSQAVRANQDIQSASFTLDGSYNIPFSMLGGTIRGDAHMEGILQDGGEIVQAFVQTEASTGDMNIQTDFDVITAPHNETYIKIRTVDTKPVYPLLTPDIVSRIIDRWWEMPTDNANPREIMPTPDPILLKAQSQVVSVIGDLGFDIIRSRRVYHYQVEVDREKLYNYLITLSKDNAQDVDEEYIRTMLDGLSALGELWIDAETFYLQRIIWTIEALNPKENKPMTISFTMDLMDHNNTDHVVLPEDSDLFTVEELLPPLDTSPTSSFDGFPSGLEDEIIKRLLEGTQEVTPSP